MVSTGSALTRQYLAATGAAAVMLCLLLPVDADAGKLYRWVDEDGNVHFSDRMPADASDAAHRVMGEDGTVLEEKESSADERERRRQREARDKEDQRRAGQERRAAEERRQKDRIIQQTFATERDITFTRANRVEAVQVQINIARHGIERLQAQRTDYQQRIDRLPADSPAAEINRERIAEVDARLETRRANKAQLEEQLAEIETRFDNYLERFRELNPGGD